MCLTLAQIRDTLDFHLHFPWSKGGMIRQWHALRRILLLWYETLIAEIRNSAVLHADETGWRVRVETQAEFVTQTPYTDADARRLAARLEKYRDELFTFLSQPEVPATNNHGEREVRFAVLIRKIMYGTAAIRVR